METVRSLTEELEGYERCVEQVLKSRKRNRRKVQEDYKIAAFLRECERLVSGKFMDEKQAAEMKDMIDAEKTKIEGEGMVAFNKEKRRLVEYYTKFPNATKPQSVLEVCREKGDKVPAFTGEEREGKFLDLHSSFHQFVNLPNIGNTSYVEFLGNLGNFSMYDIFKTKSKPEYYKFLEELEKYLISFHVRVEALVTLDFKSVSDRFSSSWADGVVAGWERTKLENTVTEGDLVKKFTTEQLAKELLVRGGKSGGTAPQRAARLRLLLQHTEEDKSKKLRKARLFNAKRVALAETKVQFLVEKLGDYIEATKTFITRKQTRTFAELQQEEEEEQRLREAGDDDDDEALYEDDEEDKLVINNPLNLPLDFDGKPIPLWLYKLHGLGVEYKCEICGNYSYWGRKNFEAHFQQWRHNHSMSLLGIPNTKHFHHITEIEEAKALNAKLQQVLKKESFNPDEDEQFEDSQGNVMNKKTYLDLKRQGLL